MPLTKVPRVLVGLAGLSLIVSGQTSASATEGCGPPPSRWKTVRPDRAQVANTIVIHQKRPAPGARVTPPTWNGGAVTPEQAREYLGITKMMNPVPTLLLIVSPSADCAEVTLFRDIVDEALECGMDECVEVSP